MGVTKILILAANPKDTTPLRLDEEVREIRESLKLSKQRDDFEVYSVHAVRIKDLRRSLLEYDPQIVHFSGHGTGVDGLALEDATGKSQLVSTSSLAGLFELFPDVECVVLNACYSVAQADAIAQHVSHVVGMAQAIGDEAAKQFSMGFYDGLGSGRDYGQAFKFGKSAIELEGLSNGTIPKLLAAKPELQDKDHAGNKPSRKRNQKNIKLIEWQRNTPEPPGLFPIPFLNDLAASKNVTARFCIEEYGLGFQCFDQGLGDFKVSVFDNNLIEVICLLGKNSKNTKPFIELNSPQFSKELLFFIFHMARCDREYKRTRDKGYQKGFIYFRSKVLEEL